MRNSSKTPSFTWSIWCQEVGFALLEMVHLLRFKIFPCGWSTFRYSLPFWFYVSEKFIFCSEHIKNSSDYRKPCSSKSTKRGVLWKGNLWRAVTFVRKALQARALCPGGCPSSPPYPLLTRTPGVPMALQIALDFLVCELSQRHLISHLQKLFWYFKASLLQRKSQHQASC